jgi:hypothetical protein
MSFLSSIIGNLLEAGVGILEVFKLCRLLYWTIFSSENWRKGSLLASDSSGYDLDWNLLYMGAVVKSTVEDKERK